MNRHIGSKFDDFLDEEGLLVEVQVEAVKRVVAYELQQLMKSENVSRTELAERLNTSRTGLKRLLDEENTRITLKTLATVAQVVEKKLQIRFN